MRYKQDTDFELYEGIPSKGEGGKKIKEQIKALESEGKKVVMPVQFIETADQYLIYYIKADTTIPPKEDLEKDIHKDVPPIHSLQTPYRTEQPIVQFTGEWFKLMAMEYWYIIGAVILLVYFYYK